MTRHSGRHLSRAWAVAAGIGFLMGACCSTQRAGSPDLLAALRSGDERTALRVLEEGADPNAKDADGRTALMYASRQGLAVVVTALIRKAADLDAQANDGRTALMEAASACETTVVESLLQNGARRDLRDGGGRNALDHVPAESADERCLSVRRLLNHP